MVFPAHADSVGSEPATHPSATPIAIFNPADADIMQESFAWGPKPPIQYKNLNGQTYHIFGAFDTAIYTSYYFHPNAHGVFNYSFTFTWQAPCGTQRMARVECWDKTTNKMVLSRSFDMSENSNGLYSPFIVTGAWKVYNLNPNHTYYLRFSKTFDRINATVNWVVYTYNYKICRATIESLLCIFYGKFIEGEKNDNNKIDLYSILIEMDCLNFYDHWPSSSTIWGNPHGCILCPYLKAIRTNSCPTVFVCTDRKYPAHKK